MISNLNIFNFPNLGKKFLFQIKNNTGVKGGSGESLIMCYIYVYYFIFVSMNFSDLKIL